MKVGEHSEQLITMSFNVGTQKGVEFIYANFSEKYISGAIDIETLNSTHHFFIGH